MLPNTLQSLYLRMQNSEILVLTYGSIVRQLIADYEDVQEVNKQLDKMYVCLNSYRTKITFDACTCFASTHTIDDPQLII